MARYGNLKDYFQGEHLELIRSTIAKYYLSKYNQVVDIKNVRIQKLRCVYGENLPDSDSNLEAEAGVSVQFINKSENINSELHFLVMISGDLRLKLSDIKVNVIKEIFANEMPEETIYNQFLLPNINADDIERLFKEFYHLISDDKDIKSVQPLTFMTFLKDLQLPIYFADLDDTCLGRLNLAESDIDIYMFDEIKNDLVLYSKKAIYGTVILNRKKYYEEKDGELLITLSHELVHWVFHQKFFRILVLLGNDDESLNCKAQLPIFNNNLNDSQKALCIAEWQANELSWRIVMPEVGVKYWIEKFNEINSIKNSPTCFSHKLIVVDIAIVYNVSPYVAKKRLRQLGYDYVDSTFLEYEENGIKINPAPFYFTPDTLKENETFVIYRNNYERLLRENEDFAELIENRYFVYTGYVICINSTKYISPVYTDRGLSFELTDYAHEHADECCLKFIYCPKHSITTNNVFDYLCKLDDEKYSKGEKLTLEAINDYESYNRMKKDEKEAKRILVEMEQKGIISFKDALRFHIKRLGLHRKDIWDQIYLGESTFKSYCDRGSEPSLENALIICNKLSLPYLLSINLLERAHITLNTAEKRDQMYDYLLTITNATLDEWKLFLTKYGFPSLVTQSN